LDDRFLAYFLNNIEYAWYINGSTRDKLTQAQLGSINVSYPNLDRQKLIADFLDREIAHIDALVAKKRQLVMAMEEKKKAFATEASTRGLDPTARMQATGIEIVSAAPAHWEVMRVARVFREVAEKGIEGLPVLSVSINWGISDKELADEDRQRIVNQIADKTAYKRIQPNDLVYNMMRAWQGGFGVSRVQGLVSPAYVVARPHREIHAAYYEHLLRTPMWIEEFRRASKGIADFRQRLYWEHFRLVPILVPPLHEQQQIASAIAANNARLDRVADKVSESVERLTELRASLITAAVTGQIDPATYRASGATDRALDRIAEGVAQ
jgi:type I restriction enzyme S subunit